MDKVGPVAVPTLPTQVSPPELSLSEEPPARVRGAEVLALPVLAGGEDGRADGVTLGPGAAELLDRTELDLFAVLEHQTATAFQRDTHHDAAPLLGDLQRTVSSPRLHRRHPHTSSCDRAPTALL